MNGEATIVQAITKNASEPGVSREVLAIEDERSVQALVADVQLPLENAGYAIEDYLRAHNHRLDAETRALLCGLASCLTRAASATRSVTEADRPNRDAKKDPASRLVA